jgi:hypothetical protein
MATLENSEFSPSPDADLPCRLRCALFNIICAPGLPALHSIDSIPSSKFFVRQTGERNALHLLKKLQQHDLPDYIISSQPTATWLRVEINTGSKRVQANRKLNFIIVASIEVLGENLEPLASVTYVRFEILANENGEVMNDRDNWAGFVDLLKILILAKYGWKGEIKEQRPPYCLITGDGVVS